MIVVFTRKNSRGQFTACAEAQSDSWKSNFPPTRLGVRAVSKIEATAALRCACKAVSVLDSLMLPLTTVRQIVGGLWKVEFKQKAA